MGGAGECSALRRATCMPRVAVKRQVQTCCSQLAPASKLAAHLVTPHRRLGFHYAFDVNFSGVLTGFPWFWLPCRLPSSGFQLGPLCTAHLSTRSLLGWHHLLPSPPPLPQPT